MVFQGIKDVTDLNRLGNLHKIIGFVGLKNREILDQKIFFLRTKINKLSEIERCLASNSKRFIWIAMGLKVGAISGALSFVETTAIARQIILTGCVFYGDDLGVFSKDFVDAYYVGLLGTNLLKLLNDSIKKVLVTSAVKKLITSMRSLAKEVLIVGLVCSILIAFESMNPHY